MKKLISIVIPVYNEEEVIPELNKQLKKFINKFPRYRFEVIFVENGSCDSSWSLLKQLADQEKRYKIVQLSKNLGTDGGIAAGLRYASGDAAVTIMADLQEPIELIAEFIKKWEKGFDIAYGIVNKRTAGLINNFYARLFYKIINLLTGNVFPENVADFKLLDRKVYQAVNQMHEQNKYLRGLTIWTGFKQTGINFNRRSRFAGVCKADFLGNLKTALNGILSFSYLPLHLIAVLGLVIILTSFGLIVYCIIRYLISGRETPEVAMIILSSFFLFGVLFFVLGIISQYLIRIYDEVKRRPNFIVKNTYNLD